MSLPPMAGMVMFVRAMLARMLVIMFAPRPGVRMFVRMLMLVFMGMTMRVFVRVRLPIMRMLVAMCVAVLVQMFVFVFVLAFHRGLLCTFGTGSIRTVGFRSALPFHNDMNRIPSNQWSIHDLRGAWVVADSLLVPAKSGLLPKEIFKLRDH
ncbi:MAG: hypothetical protein WAW37_03225 [Syntrophobacteraceae bacterium]